MAPLCSYGYDLLTKLVEDPTWFFQHLGLNLWQSCGGKVLHAVRSTVKDFERSFFFGELIPPIFEWGIG